jgi:peptidoglycan hydrolase-like protein with peptidoglycan-binding domain
MALISKARLAHSVSSARPQRSGDTKYVQFLLADWQMKIGDNPLKIDGLCGAKTNAAIRKFQKTYTKVEDGRVDPAGPTIRELERLHGKDLLAAVRKIPTTSLGSPRILASDIAMEFSRYLDELRAAFGR